MPTSIAEDYLKHIFLEQEKLAHGAFVSTSAISQALGVTPGTATAMIQGLAEDGYLEYRKRGGSRLTEKGEDEAVQIVRRHRLVETFLAGSLGLDWAEVHTEADRLEHAISEKVAERLEDYMGFPTVDPHGDPIPNAVGWLDRQSFPRLPEAPLGVALRLVRLLDQSPDFLRFAKSRGLLPGSRLSLLDSGAVSGATLLKPEKGEAIALGIEAARGMLVEILAAD